MRMKYEFPKTPELGNLALEVENRGGIILFDVAGAEAAFFRSLFEFYFGWLNKLGPTREFKDSYVYSLYLPPIPSKAHNRMVEGFLNTFLFKRKTPQAVTIAVTNKCQCRCEHCSNTTMHSSRPPMSPEVMQRVIRESVELGVSNVTLTGGDPLLAKDLADLMAAVDPQKAVTQVFTNAIGLDQDKIAGLKRQGIYGLQMSLDSPDPAEHDQGRGFKGAFDAVKRGAALAAEGGVLTGLSTFATEQSVESRKLTDIAALAAEWGICEITVFNVIPTGRLLNREDLILSDDAHKTLMREAARLNIQHKGQLRIVTQSWTNCGVGFARSFGCLAGNYQFHITALGDFTPCDFTPLTFGNVSDEPVEALWKRITKHPAYHRHSNKCRMQSLKFRGLYIHPIPADGLLPFPIYDLEAVEFEPDK